MTELIVFTGKNCAACEVSKRIFFENDIEFTEKSVLENMQEARKYGVRSVPTFVLIKENGTEVVYTGSVSAQTVVDSILGSK